VTYQGHTGRTSTSRTAPWDAQRRSRSPRRGVGFWDFEARDTLAALSERSVGNDALPASHSHRRRVFHRPQPITKHIRARGLQSLSPVPGVIVLGVVGLTRGVVADNQYVAHGLLEVGFILTPRLRTTEVAEALRLKATQVLADANSSVLRQDPRVVNAVDRVIAAKATDTQQIAAYGNLQAYVDKVGSITEQGINADDLLAQAAKLMRENSVEVTLNPEPVATAKEIFEIMESGGTPQEQVELLKKSVLAV